MARTTNARGDGIAIPASVAGPRNTAGNGAELRAGERMPSPTQPNILVIWGDDIGVYNVSAYHRGLMGGSTPNIVSAEPDTNCRPSRAAWMAGTRSRARLGLVTYPSAPVKRAASSSSRS